MNSHSPLFAQVAPQLSAPETERTILALWKERGILARALAANPEGPPFVFFEGPPTANGLPHNGHVLTRVLKDLFLRYRSMQGYSVPRKAGWDTHGLPVEVEVEKSLGIHGKEAIERYGIERFSVQCIRAVFRYVDEWERLDTRLGFWIDLPSAYVTFHKTYVESVWWALSQLFQQGLLYRGHKVLWWWAQGGTALSAAEVGQGYKQVDDPSLFVAFPLTEASSPACFPGLPEGPPLSLLVWTTTPWTLPSNAYVAVHPAQTYAIVNTGTHRYVVAADLVPSLTKTLSCDLTVEGTCLGAKLVGLRYHPPFDLYSATLAEAHVTTSTGTRLPMYWRVLAADFVTLESGSGLVHIAPAFGEDDHQAHQRECSQYEKPEEVPLLCAVKPDGTFVDEFLPYAGRWVKACDKELQEELRTRGLLVHAGVVRHDYPFCPRSEKDPLIQYARPAWYIRTTRIIDKARALNREIHWVPGHVGAGRFDDFLANNVDWALSRERYWGTPLNLWINDVTGTIEAPASVQEILAKNPHAFDPFWEAKKADPSLSEHLLVHKPWIDQVTWQKNEEPGVYRRVPDVIDCWFDAGCMPFAQWGFPHQGETSFRKAQQADFLCEAIDQTRGWFYALLMVATALGESLQKELALREPAPLLPAKPPYKACVVLGHVSDKEGKKESKSKGNYTLPQVILDRVGMDFAVCAAEEIPGLASEPGVAWIPREDLDGLDLTDRTNVVLHAGEGAPPLACTVRVHSKLRRRMLALHADDRTRLALSPVPMEQSSLAHLAALPPTSRVRLETQGEAPGADAFRWFFYSSGPVSGGVRHSLAGVRSCQKEFLLKLRNVFSFFTLYANLDRFDPYAEPIADGPAPELDRWLKSELALTIEGVIQCLHAYDPYGATRHLTQFVEGLSNWYVRRSRDRFWRAGWDADKQSAYTTLWQALVSLSTLLAPFTPFLAEEIYQNLVVGPSRQRGIETPDSVHLARYPEAVRTDLDAALSAKMETVRELVRLGLQVRMQHTLKVRQPLASARVILANPEMREALLSCSTLIQEELNVLAVEFVPPDAMQQFASCNWKPNFRTLGQRGLGREAQRLKQTMGALSADEANALYTTLLQNGQIVYEGVTLGWDDLDLLFDTKAGFAAAGSRAGVVVLETELNEPLLRLGFLREFLNRVQQARKEAGLAYSDRIALSVAGSVRAGDILTEHREALQRETLAETFHFHPGVETLPEAREVTVEGEPLRFCLTRCM